MTEDKLRHLIERYVVSLDAKRAAMEDALGHFVSVCEAGNDIRETHRFPDLRRDVHQLAGSAGSMGFSALGQAAVSLENMVNALAESHNVPSLREIRKIRAHFERIALRIETTRSEDSSLFTLSHQGIDELPPSEPPNTIILLSKKSSSYQHIVGDLALFGLDLIFCDTKNELFTLIEHKNLRAVLIDMNAPVAEISSADVRMRCSASISLVVLSDVIDMRCRVDAWHDGIGAVVQADSTGAEIVDAIEYAAGSVSHTVSRVLLVDDDESILAVCEHVLSESGIQCETLQHPENILDVISTFRPDLLIIDRHMPDYDGLEVAAAIRQQSAYTNLPLIFLTRDDSPESRVDAIKAGGDGYVTKPVDMEYLLALVRQRILRSRQLQAMISRDGLTGLLNHAAFYVRLESEIAQSIRNGSALSVMLLDLDHFKKVNDTWGHPAGDAVLQSLARLLRQRLRSGDHCGRLGGEEFAIMFTNTKAEDALGVGQKLLAAFKEVVHHSGTETFVLTFSAGLAELTADMTAEKILAAADRALYSAKRGGRSQVKWNVGLGDE